MLACIMMLMKHSAFHRLFKITLTEVIEVTETITVSIETDLSTGAKNNVHPDLNLACLPCAAYRVWHRKQKREAQHD